MVDRQRDAAQHARASTEAYVRDVAGSTPVDQISTATRLLESGTINREEFTKIKDRALAELH